MPQLSSQQRFWKDKLVNPASTDAEKVKAAEELEKIKRRHTREKLAKRKPKKLVDDPEPKHDPMCGMSYCVDGCKHIAWYNRQPVRGTPAVEAKIEVPVVVAAPVVAPVKKVTPRPVTPRPAPVDTFWDDFKAKPIYERNMILKTLSPARLVEWQTMQEEQRLKAARAMATQPPAPSMMLTHEQKMNLGSAPMVRHDVFDAGKPQTVDELRETYAPTMGNATPDSGLSPDLDRRGWLPDLNPLS